MRLWLQRHTEGKSTEDRALKTLVVHTAFLGVQDLRAAASPAHSALDPRVDLDGLLATVACSGFVTRGMPDPPVVRIVVGQCPKPPLHLEKEPATRDAVVQTGNYAVILKELRELSHWLSAHHEGSGVASAMSPHDVDQLAASLGIRCDPTTWTVLEQDGPNHLVWWRSACP